MNTEDLHPPRKEKKGDIGNRKNTRISTEKTRYSSHTENIHISKSAKKKDLLLIAEPISEKTKRRLHALPFILIMIFLGVSTMAGFIALNLSAQKTKTIDFYFSEAKAASRRLKEGAELFSQKKFNESGDRFSQAKGSLQAIDKQLWFVPVSSSFSFVDPRLRSARAAIQASIRLAQTGEQSASLGQEILPYLKDPQTLKIPLTEYISQKHRAVENIVYSLSQATQLLNQIDTKILPVDFVDEYSKAFAALSTITKSAQFITANYRGIMAVLGENRPHTILVVLQNSSELRPTGGFIGNVALIQFDKGALTQQQVIDVYAFDHKLTEKIEPPAEIKLINDRWFMRDSNSSIDFPTSAKNIAKFLEKEGGPKVDTVVTIDQTVIENLLSVTGPLKIPELTSELTSENFERVLSFIVEAKIYGREDPKVLLKSLLPAMKKATLDSKKTLEVYQVLSAAISSKHSMAYSSNENIENLIKDVNAAGIARAEDVKNENPTTDISDFFALTHFSVGGNKTDKYMKEKILHNTYIEEDGSIINEVTISRTNTWSQKNEDSLRAVLATFGFKEIPPHVLNILGKSWNIHMLRVYVPKGSVLLEKSDNGYKQDLSKNEGAEMAGNSGPRESSPLLAFGMEDSDVGATYFSVRLDVAPGDTYTTTLRYKIPQMVEVKNSLLSPGATITYNLNIIKQPSQDDVHFEKNIFPSNGMRVQSNAKNTFTVTRDTRLSELLVR